MPYNGIVSLFEGIIIFKRPYSVLSFIVCENSMNAYICTNDTNTDLFLGGEELTNTCQTAMLPKKTKI